MIIFKIFPSIFWVFTQYYKTFLFASCSSCRFFSLPPVLVTCLLGRFVFQRLNAHNINHVQCAFPNGKLFIVTYSGLFVTCSKMLRFSELTAYFDKFFKNFKRSVLKQFPLTFMLLAGLHCLCDKSLFRILAYPEPLLTTCTGVWAWDAGESTIYPEQKISKISTYCHLHQQWRYDPSWLEKIVEFCGDKHAMSLRSDRPERHRRCICW